MEAAVATPRSAGRVAGLIEATTVILIGYSCHLYYNLIGHLSSLRGVDFGPWLMTPLDRAMPYLPLGVHPYQIAYFMPGLVLVLLVIKFRMDPPSVRRLVAAFLCLLFTQYALYLLFPVSARSIRLADEAIGSGMLAELVRYQYHLATVWCAWPSLHVSACWLFYRVLAQYYRRFHWIYLVWFVAMVVGTVSIKIHYVLDGVTGLVLGELAYRFLFVRFERTGAFAWPPNRVRAVIQVVVLAALLAGIRIVMSLSGFEGPLYTVGMTD
jgi:membrane-associated phospholipid phosphatase